MCYTNSMNTLIVAENILKQLGGNKFAVMTGAKNFAGDENSLSFRIGRNSSKSNHVKIVLNSMDTYDVTFGHIRKMEYVVDKTYEGIYNDQLVEIFENYTGLRTKLFKEGS